MEESPYEKRSEDENHQPESLDVPEDRPGGAAAFVLLDVRPHGLPHLVSVCAVGGAGLGGLFAYQLYYAKRRDIFDEFARENLRTTDSICLKIACGVLVLAAVLCVFSDFSGIVVGYALLIKLLALTVARAVLFTVIDKRGM